MRGSLPVRNVFGVGLLLVGLLASLPPAEAQGPADAVYTVEIDARHDPAPVQPIREVRTIQAEVTIRCASPGADGMLTPEQVRFDARSDAVWAVATLSKTTDHFEMDPQDCLHGYEHLFRFSVDVTVTKDAPAYAMANLHIRAHLDDGSHAVAVVPIKAGFYENWQAKLERTLVKGSAWEIVQVPLVIENHGNGEIQVRVQVHEESSKALVVALPGPQVVPSLIAGGETNKVTIPIDVRLPDDGPRIDQLMLVIQGNSMDDTSAKLTPLQVVAAFQTDGGGGSGSDPTLDDVGELPGPGALFVPLVAALVAILGRRPV